MNFLLIDPFERNDGWSCGNKISYNSLDGGCCVYQTLQDETKQLQLHYFCPRTSYLTPSIDLIHTFSNIFYTIFKKDFKACHNKMGARFTTLPLLRAK